ncbi:hypothetical protein VTH8203_01343 [Vibrio thalassae]|uniref:Uncharacterized protein n=1 Tax=Vibrio thalassae TaxID=1243014 RepID=A0A240EGB1_9VIBR|nr:hypothetical protein VTH8203_01343 [Vibrio thalassae]
MTLSIRNKVAYRKLIRLSNHYLHNPRPVKTWSAYTRGMENHLDELKDSLAFLASIPSSSLDIEAILTAIHTRSDGIVFEDLSETRAFIRLCKNELEGNK